MACIERGSAPAGAALEPAEAAAATTALDRAGSGTRRGAGEGAVRMCPTRAGASSRLLNFDVTLMEHYLDPLVHMKGEFFEMVKENPKILPAWYEGMSKDEHRQVTRDAIRAILNKGYAPLSLLANDPRAYYYLGELVSLMDLSVAVKLGVQYSLFGGTILNLGTDRHRRQFFDDVDRMRIKGCFAMTELRHGSNVGALATEAVLDLDAGEWVVHTPDDGAIKWWIGGAARDATMAVVFARLKLPSEDGSGALDDRGVHALLVPLRDPETHACLPGVEIRDLGDKVGLQGVDNGAIRFTHVRVPKGNLLDRFAGVGPDGRYANRLPTESLRFAATLGELTGGRVGVCRSSLSVMRTALVISVRYSQARTQFAPPGGLEHPLLDYPSTQLALLVPLAACYGRGFATRRLVDSYSEMRRTKDPELVADVHAASAGLKAVISDATDAFLGVARVATGGHGYSALNRLGTLRADHDVYRTFEGDNVVLLQQVAQALLAQYAKGFEGSPLKASWSYLKAFIGNALPLNPLRSHDTDPRHIRDPRFLLSALEHRTGRLLRVAAAKLRARARARRGTRAATYDAWTRTLPLLLDLARAHVDYIVADAFFRGVEACADAECRAALRALSELHVLDILSADPTFRDGDYLAPEKAAAIRSLRNSIALEVRAIAVPLVNAFGIPDHVLRAPIGVTSTAADPYGAYLKANGF